MKETIKLFYKKAFDNKIILVLVPHPDDEINLFGNLLDTLSRCADCRVTVAYLTNGDYYGMPVRRLVEAQNALKILSHGKKVDVVYLGYPESDFSQILNAETDKLTSFNGLVHTYGTNVQPEYHYSMYGKHAEISYENIRKDISSLIGNIHPDYLFANLEDKHPAHILLSRIVDEIVRANECDCTVLRGYCYETAWTAPRDFYSINPLSCKRSKHSSIAEDDWAKRIRMPVLSGCRMQFFCGNNTVRALKAHKSQEALGAAKSVINGDCVYWLHGLSSKKMDYMKILVEDDFAYRYRVTDKKCTVRLGIYECVDGISQTLREMQSISVRTDGDLLVQGNILRLPKGRRTVTVYAEDKRRGLTDKIVLIRVPTVEFKLYKLMALVEQVLVRGYSVINKYTIQKGYEAHYSGASIWKQKTNYDV